jgi:hypothetical protein
VIFTPFDSRHVGIYDPAANVYRSGAAHRAGVGSAYSGSAELADGRIVMAPRNAAHIGIYNPRTDTFTRGPEHGEGPGAFMAAAVMPGGEVVMAPYFSDHVGIYDPELDEYRSGPSVAHVERNQEGRFSGANLTWEGDRLIMTNRGTAVIGIVREHPFFRSGAVAEAHFRYRPAGGVEWRETERIPVPGAGVHRQRIALEAAGDHVYQFVLSSAGSTKYGEAKTISR